MDQAEREALIARIEDGYGAIVASLDGIADGEWEAREAPEEWSPRQVVHHLADSEMTAAVRLRRLIAEDQPAITGYDQDLFAAKLHYDRPIEQSLAAFKGARESSAQLLRCLDEDEWQRAGTHTEHGRYSIEDWLGLYAAHAHDHADQIRRARATWSG